ncbi:MAG: biopolymer transporter ExbD [Planctomycetes bacterium]|nr:biopolymer transporter ExbD [Planctomycetota bacterium]
MEFRQKQRRKPNLNITPLIDVLFLLLIFFLVSSTFVEQPNIKLDLPRAAHADVSKVKSLAVLINKTGQLYFRDRLVGKRELSGLLRKALQDDKDQSLVIKADKRVAHGVVVEVLDVAKGVGFKRIILPTSPEETEESRDER